MTKICGSRWLSCDGSLTAESPSGMKMTYRNGERVGSIHGFGRSGKFEQTDHHVLNLLLFGAPVSDDRGLDGQRRIFSDFESGGSSGQHRYAAHLPELERRLHVEGVEDVFDRDFIRLVFGDDRSQMSVNARQATGQEVLAGRA